LGARFLDPPLSPGSPPLVSVVPTAFNQLAYTLRCLDSVVGHLRRQAVEIIVVDNASTDGAVEALRSRADVKLLCNPTHPGFPTAVNQGIRAGRGECIVLLNNDTLVTRGRLDRLLAHLHVPPMSVSSAGSQTASAARNVLPSTTTDTEMGTGVIHRARVMFWAAGARVPFINSEDLWLTPVAAVDYNGVGSSSKGGPS
jgi:glycosyltransferase involved in cell wall biosynthesis